MRILAFDLQVATIAGAMMDRARGLGRRPASRDVAIAATAQARGLTILTRNVRHFQAIYARVLNPIDGPAPPLAYVAPETPNRRVDENLQRFDHREFHGVDVDG